MKTTETEITVNFDNLPDNIGVIKNDKHLLSPSDMTPTVRYLERLVAGGCDTLTLEGYLPPWMWAVVGAFASRIKNVHTIRYRAQNGLVCELILDVEAK